LLYQKPLQINKCGSSYNNSEEIGLPVSLVQKLSFRTSKNKRIDWRRHFCRKVLKIQRAEKFFSDYNSKVYCEISTQRQVPVRKTEGRPMFFWETGENLA